jgi:hypothetical protein
VSEKFIRPKLATRLPPEKELKPEDFEQLHREAREYRDAVDVHAARVETIDQEDLRVRVR